MVHFGGGNRDIVPPIQQQRSPGPYRLSVVGVLHVLKEMMFGHSLVTGLEKIDLLLTMDKTDVRYGIDKFLWGANHSFGDGVAPELS